MIWSCDELALAVRLTGKLGYTFSHTSAIMARHGYSGRSPADIKQKIKTDAPKDWAAIEAAQKKRQSKQLCGVYSPPPRGRMPRNDDELIGFVLTLRTDLTAGRICWLARERGYNCNVTDIIDIAAVSEYKLSTVAAAGVSFSDAVNGDLCLWPVAGDLSCGAKREKNRYCGEHYCCSLGGNPLKSK